MKEVALRLGAEQNLVGVMTSPEGARRPLAVLTLNAGVIHRIGPARMHVRLGRHLAQRGYTAVRFDLSGVGDSRAPRAAAPHREQAIADIRAVMDHLERTQGLRAFALWGICSGAENAYRATLRDERVAGVFMLDGYVYPTLKGLAIDLVSRLRVLSFAKVQRRLGGLVRSAAEGGRPAPGAELEAPLSRPTRAQFAADIERLVERGVRVAMLFSTNSGHRYPGQMHDAFRRCRFMSHVVCHHAPELNHLLTLHAAQQRVLALADEWIDAIDAHPNDR